MVKRRFSAWALAGMCSLIALFTPQLALAHAVLQKSQPAVNASIDASKNNSAALPIVLTFNSRIDASHSSLALMSGDGKSALLVIDAKAEPNILRSTVSGLKPGHYSLHWQVVASDGHISRGTIPFTVR